MQSIMEALTPVAEQLPTQKVARSASRAGNTSKPIVQFLFGLTKGLRKELARLADDTDMTMRAFILQALREKGLGVEEGDLLDMRKEQSRGPVRG